jgi:hypothetical protein
LHVTGTGGAAIAHAVAVLDRSGENVSDGLNAAMRMPGKAGEVIFGKLIAEIIEQKKRIIVRGVPKSKSSPQVNSCAFHSGLGLDYFFNGTDGHGGASMENGNANRGKKMFTTEDGKRGRVIGNPGVFNTEMRRR